MTIKVGFRVATDPRSGAGHLVRSSAVAAAMKGTVTLFSDPSLPGDFDRLAWNSTISEASTDSLALAKEALSRREIDALVIDSYAIPTQIVAEASSAGSVAAFRDSDEYGPECISINCNPDAKPAANVFAGPSYIPLLPEFMAAHKRACVEQRPRLHAPDILVAFGARDSDNYTARAVEAIASLPTKPRTIVAVPPSAAHIEDILQLIQHHPWAEPLAPARKMSNLYANCDLAIGAPGVSQFERACCGLPTILVAQGDVHAPLAAAWERTGAARHCGPHSDGLAAMLNALLADASAIASMRERALSIVDGQGALRLAQGLKARFLG
jgi:spore coat polysaccharide biosynthesis predicted glycosyltransferase SpsG